MSLKLLTPVRREKEKPSFKNAKFELKNMKAMNRLNIAFKNIQDLIDKMEK